MTASDDRRDPVAGDHDWGDFDAWNDAGAPHDRGAERPWSGLDDDPRVQVGLEHLQRAAHEMIAASRALLDVAEDVVDAPGGVTKFFGAIADLGQVASRVVRSGGAPSRTDDGPDQDPPVQRIPVS